MAVAFAAAVTLGLVATGPAVADPPTPAQAGAAASKKLTSAVTPAGVLGHLRQFQRIADANGDTRASGTPGYDRSADYVAQKLQRAGYRVSRQSFQFPFFEELNPSKFAQVTPTPTTYVNGTDFYTLAFSGDGVAQGTVTPVDVNLAPPRATTSGCEAADFAGFPRGNIALVQRGTCDFAVKAANAAAAGAIGVIIFNQGNGTEAENPDRYEAFQGNLGGPVPIPAISTTYALGAQLAGTTNTVVRIETDTLSETRTTQNVLAETPGGRADNVVMAGAHLDSVPEGPGINDNGTGSAGLLEVALKYAPLAKHAKPTNKVRFAWWGAEESGLLGSEHYVASLTPAQVANIGLYLNFDMIGSPNYKLAVYDGDNSTGTGTPPAGSGALETLFRKYLASRGQQAVDSEFDGRSDYGPFIAEGIGIPSGGLFTGAEGIKTADEAAKFGGVPDVAYDPCYHQACDSFTPTADGGDAATYQRLAAAYGRKLVGNVNVFALDVNSDAIADAVARLAFDTSGISAPGDTPTAAAAAAPSGGQGHLILA
ncbi:M28 family peptidase [Cryptosporangium aurantiacum]|uniref:M28 family peptidase n=1 Tax=Cryptosporangium aurantiacum TaxID=134849 RepID=UPI000933247A|nr:M28 family peptidase [Cryptosporangium aurantiacum]